MNAQPLVPVQLPPRLDARWLRALVIEGRSNDVIREQLAADALPPASDAELDAVRAAYPPPANFAPASRSHAPSFRFVCQAGIEPIVRRDRREADGALALLRHARARELVEAALVLDVPIGAVEKMLVSLLAVTTTAQVLCLYRATFFDTSTIARSQLRLLVQARVRMAVLHASGGAQDSPAVRRAIAADPRMLALSLPRSQSAWHSVLLALGFLPPKRDLRTALDELEGLAVLRAGQALMRGGRDDERRAEAYVNVVTKLRTVEAALANPNEGVIKTIQRLQIQTETVRMPSVAQLIARGDQVGTLEVGPAGADEEEEHAQHSG